MSRDFVSAYRWNTNEPSSVNQKDIGRALESLPIVGKSAEDEPRLTMGRLRAYLERRPFGPSPDQPSKMALSAAILYLRRFDCTVVQLAGYLDQDYSIYVRITKAARFPQIGTSLKT
jgi:hypothetical protein